MLTIAKPPSHQTSKQQNRNQGVLAEDIATQYLQSHGYTILQRNLRTKFGEIDILAMKDGEYVGAEVKSRSKHSVLPPELNITPQKYSRIVRSLLSLPYLNNKPARIDVITIEGTRVRRHFKAVEFPSVD